MYIIKSNDAVRDIADEVVSYLDSVGYALVRIAKIKPELIMADIAVICALIGQRLGSSFGSQPC